MDMAQYRNPYPRLMYHATELPKMVKSEEEEHALGEGWSTTYIYQAYPKTKFNASGESCVVANPEEETALGAGWTDTPPVNLVDPEAARERRREPDHHDLKPDLPKPKR